MSEDYLGNPGTVGNAANKATQKVVLGIDGWVKENVAGLKELFSKETFNPDNQDIFTRRSEIELNFFEAIVAHDVHEQDVDPLVVEEFEQLLSILSEDRTGVSISDREVEILQKMKDNPENYGLKTSSANIFSDNAGVRWEPQG